MNENLVTADEPQTVVIFSKWARSRGSPALSPVTGNFRTVILGPTALNPKKQPSVIRVT
jgi:hypothetical protein